MSHVVQIKSEIRDFNAVKQTCTRLQLEPPAHGTYQLYQLERALGVKQGESLKPEFYANQTNTIQQLENE